MTDQKPSSAKSSKQPRVPAALGTGLDAEIDKIIDRAQTEGLQLTGKEGLLGGLIKKAVESGMNAEMTEHLGYEKHAVEGRGTGNSRNGTTTSTVHTNVGPVELDKPRDRNGEFDSKVVAKGTRRLGEFEDMVLSLFGKGMTTRDIAEHLEVTYDAEISHETISNITDAINETVKQWRNRPLEEVYPILYIDAIRIRIRDGGQVRIKACHVAVGVDLDGRKRVLGMWIEQTEGAKFWAGVLTELRNRGVRDVLIVCCDGLTGLPEAIAATWPKAKVQTCVVHLIRNAMRYASWKDRKGLAQMLKPIYTAPTLQAAEEAFGAFEDSDPGKRCPAAVEVIRRAWEEFIPFLELPEEIRRVVYTTNAIESMNYQLRKVTKNRGQFPNDEAAYKLLYLAICDIEARTTSRGGGKEKKLLMRGAASQHWTAALNQFELHFPGRLPAGT